MALSRPLAKLERVDDLRTIWSSEPADFTPWLAEEDSLSILSEALGLDLELVAQEQGVGPYRADILCRDLATGTNVLIENQLESTDHPHLGQILTYAAGLDARTIIWIAKRSTEEHRAAVDWLNEVTVDGFSFFLLEIELWKFVGSDNVAPKFNIVSKPNDWRRSVAERARSSELTETQSLYLEYWTALRDYIKRCGGAVTPQKPAPQHWVNCALGRSGALGNQHGRFCVQGEALDWRRNCCRPTSRFRTEGGVQRLAGATRIDPTRDRLSTGLARTAG